jgi:hypothetical protein
MNAIIDAPYNGYDDFVALLNDMVSVLGLPPLKLEEKEPGKPIMADFTVESIEFTLVYSPLKSMEHATLVCRMGPPPTEKRAEALERLLEMNFMLSNDPVSIGIDPFSGDAVLSAVYAIYELDARMVFNAMRIAVGQARKWRETYYLDEIGAPAGLDLAAMKA